MKKEIDNLKNNKNEINEEQIINILNKYGLTKDDYNLELNDIKNSIKEVY